MPRLLSCLLAVLFLVAPLRATWSIIVLNTRTGEIAVASATCVDNSDLLSWTPMVIPGVGVAVCQAASPREIKVLIHDLMIDGISPKRIQARIEKRFTNPPGYQYAMIDMQGRSLLFTGSRNGPWAGGVTGQDGDFIYCIQGNVLAGEDVVNEAEASFLNTQGDLSTRVMAAMEAAAAQGGDGRCSCSIQFPDSCGTPPPSFNSSATIGYVVVSRLGDTLDQCDSSGCVGLSNYLVLNEPFHSQPTTDPVVRLRQQYDTWRIAQIGRPDALQSLQVQDRDRVGQDEQALLNYWVELYDIEGVGIPQGGANFSLRHLNGSAAYSSLENVIDHQDGSYTLQVRTGVGVGLDRFAFVADDGNGAVQLGQTASLLYEAPPLAPLGLAKQLVITTTGSGSTPTVFSEILDAQVLDEGLTLWLLGDRGLGMELLRARRNSLDLPFAHLETISVAEAPTSHLTSFFVRADQQQAIFSIRESDGIQRLYSSDWDSTAQTWLEPNKLGPLQSNQGEREPALSADGLRMIYQSRESGTARVYEARRLHPLAEWFDGVELDLAPGLGAGNPYLLEDQLNFAFIAQNSPTQRFRVATRTTTDSWSEAGTITGLPHFDRSRAQFVGWSATAGRAWLVDRTASEAVLLESALHLNAFSVNPSSLSVQTGGSMQFQLNAGASFGGADYQILAGVPGTAMRWNQTPLPISPEIGLSARVRQAAGNAPLQGFVGTLTLAGTQQVDLTIASGTTFFPPHLIGQKVALTFVATSNGQDFVSNAVWIQLIP